MQQMSIPCKLVALLTMVYEDRGEFSKNRVQLYEKFLRIFLEKWDASREIERDQPSYAQLSYKQKKELLYEIAYLTFERNKYYFTLSEVDECIEQYLDKTFGQSTNPHFDTDEVLKLIESQHGLIIERAEGIYCFSHLTFHEYLTAIKISSARNDEFLSPPADCIAQTRWREVFLLAVGILDNPDSLLQSMKQKVDGLLARDENLQCFLAWVEQKSNSVEARYKPAAVRAYYFTLALSQILDLKLDLVVHLDRSLARSLARNLRGDSALAQNLLKDLAFVLARARKLDLDLDLDLDFDQTEGFPGKDELKRKLLSLKNELPNGIEDDEAYKQWWKENGDKWTEQLQAIMIEHRKIGHDWQFNHHQEQLLNQYHLANQLLVDCLNSDCRVSDEVRKQIEDTMILPISSIPPAL